MRTISEYKASLSQYPGQPRPGDFEAHWQEAWESSAPLTVQAHPVAFCNPRARYEELTITAPQGTVRARYLYPAGEKPFPLVLMFHDIVRPIRGWHHMTRFLALGYGVLALENRRVCPHWDRLSPREMALCYRDALTLAHVARSRSDVLLAWGEGFGGSLAAAACAFVPARCALLNPCPADLTDPAWAYLDAAHFAPMLKGPLLLGTGLLDPMASPEGQYALYHGVSREKRHKIYPKYGHERINFFENELLKFFHF